MDGKRLLVMTIVLMMVVLLGTSNTPTVGKPLRGFRIDVNRLTESLNKHLESPRVKIVMVAKAQLGKPYAYGASGPDSFDCSGLVMYCYGQIGVGLSHSSYSQSGSGTPVDASQLRPGDIIGFHGWGHVGLYIGNGQFIHAPQTGDVVKVTDLASRSDISGCVQILP